ncbi:MAG TPA: dUTP diphosphatase [Ignavibacteriaceae bacterium]|nr:dUTP diphosphatase [Ignavibacteriaceae bacterium]
MKSEVKINIKRISNDFNDIELPHYATEGSAGMDIRAAVNDELIVNSGATTLVPTNLSVEIPEGFEIQVRPRSGLAVNHSIGILNSPGTIDSDYRGEIKIILFNFGKKDFIIKRGDRIAQLIISKVFHASLIEHDELNSTQRGSGGFGHTGKS